MRARGAGALAFATMAVSREALYQEVSAEPMTSVAKLYGETFGPASAWSPSSSEPDDGEHKSHPPMLDPSKPLPLGMLIGMAIGRAERVTAPA